MRRYKCPFYGFSLNPSVLTDTRGNQCALVTESYSPCYMEISDETPNWNNCSFNDEQNRTKLEQIAESVRVFPEELCPGGVKIWNGIPLNKWMYKISGVKLLNP